MDFYVNNITYPEEQFDVYTSESDDMVEECFTNEEPEVDYIEFIC